MVKNLLLLSILISTSVTAQIPEDALRYSWYPNNTSARIMAVGGAMGSLGGDISATFINPAGLAIFHTSEVTLSLGWDINNLKTNYRDSITRRSHNFMKGGPWGVLGSMNPKRETKKNLVMAIAINQLACFNERIRFSGLNNVSSFSEQFAEEFSQSGNSINDVLTINSPLPYTSAPALFTYLIDTVTNNGIATVKGAPEYLLDEGQAILQDVYKRTRGSIQELAIGLAGTNDDKLLFGATLGIPFIYYENRTQFSEKDTSSNAFNKFSSFNYVDDFTSSGVGMNMKLGVIYRPQEYFRVGFAIHTPSIIGMTDTRKTALTTVLESNSGQIETFNTDTVTFTNNIDLKNNYNQYTPWKAIISASYVFRETEDIEKQKGFVTADLEYINHRGSRFRTQKDLLNSDAATSYYRALNNTIKDIYKGAFNFRLGGELKFKTIMSRIGMAYYGNPYKDKSIKSNQFILSGGLGYRNHGFFIDATYAVNFKKDYLFPYRLENRDNFSSSLKTKKDIISVTVGWKF